ncbi:MAG: LamG domain-containing protein [Patescibacteria group bacterium]|nr:LamG domain-containing protein [Patescibacteria group bacterium]
MGQGQAGSFSNSYINIGTGDDYFPLHIFSIGVWIKTPGLGQEMSMNGIVSITYGLTVYLTSSGNLAFRMDDGSSIPSITVIKSLHDDEWHHILVSFDGIDRRMYIDGELMRVTEFVGWTGSTRWPTNYARIGCENNNCSIYKFNGLIDDIRIYSRALTTSEIQTLYAQTKDKYLADMD